MEVSVLNMLYLHCNVLIQQGARIDHAFRLLQLGGASVGQCAIFREHSPRFMLIRTHDITHENGAL